MRVYDNVGVDISDEMAGSIEKASKIIERTFGRKVFSFAVLEDKKRPGRVYGVSFAFDLKEDGDG